ncbi:MAG TPA: hypothetical protein VEX62_05575 [Candidatus Limnocylindrales bacterium]|nr:hypothetical protein [Candidatus Limnocylindrales bacterium]
MPGPSKRTPQGDGPSDRRARAQRARRTRAAAKPRRLARRVSWSRRIGVAAALLLLVGGSIAFGSQALNQPGSRPSVGAPPPPAPTVIAPARLTRAADIDLAVSRPDGLRSDQEYLVRVYVNGEAVRERPLPRAEQFRIEDVPLQQGDNDIRAALVGAGGEGQRSAAVAITRDDIAPDIRIISPEDTERIHTAEQLLTGRTEAGADMSIVSGRSGNSIPTSVDAGGRFEALLELTFGQNPLTLRSEDPAGNVSQTRIVLVRADSNASLVLTISPTEADAATLPTRLEIVATVHDEHGQPIDDAVVTFGLSPPNLATTTHHTRTSDGIATWQGVDVPASPNSRGTWRITALVTLSSGAELRADELLTVN